MVATIILYICAVIVYESYRVLKKKEVTKKI